MATLQEQVAWLLSEPTLEEENAYFAEVLKDKPGVIVRRGEGVHGRGLFTASEVEEGEVVLEDLPLVVIQHTSNRFQALVCAHCLRYCGSVEQQIGQRLLLRLGAGEDLGVDLDVAWVQELADGRASLPESEHFQLPPLVRCANEVFCSEACARAAWLQYHCLLWVGQDSDPHLARAGPSTSGAGPSRPVPDPTMLHEGERVVLLPRPPMPAGVSNSVDRDALAAFFNLADSTNDIFRLAARAVAHVLIEAQHFLQGEASGPAGTSGGGTADSNTDPYWAALQVAWRPYRMGHKKLWWEAVAKPDDVEDEAGFRQQLQSLAEDAAALLRTALFDDRFAALFSTEAMAALVGMFELNNMAVEVDPPVEDYFLHVDALPPKPRQTAMQLTQPLLDALGSDYSISCQGTGFYAVQSCANHSCLPTVRQAVPEEDARARLQAARPIAAGEELCVSYIEGGLSLPERQASLRDYGFSCACPLCTQEQARAAAGT